MRQRAVSIQGWERNLEREKVGCEPVPVDCSRTKVVGVGHPAATPLAWAISWASECRDDSKANARFKDFRLGCAHTLSAGEDSTRGGRTRLVWFLDGTPTFQVRLIFGDPISLELT